MHGHFNVPKRRDRAGPHYALGVWLNAQRSMKRSFEAGKHNPGITQERIDRLTALGLEWRLRSSWDNRFAQLEDFRLEHGHCKVPAGGYTDSHGHPLHSWLKFQRAKVRASDRGNVSGSKGITQERIDRLTALGAVSSWGNRFAQLEDFRLEHGHCRVPLQGVDKPLHRWLSNQRQKVRAFDRGNVSGSKGITQEQVDLLCGIYEFDRPDH